MNVIADNRWIAGFWRRIGALIVDTLVLAFGGFVLGLLLEPVFIQMGAWAALVGFGISLGYFGVLNSRMGNGQTLGKKLLGIRVVDINNHTISFSCSLLRYAVYGIPFALQAETVAWGDASALVIYPVAFLVIGGSFSIIYLYIFNRNTRQSLHDLVAGTFVVYADAPVQPVEPVWQPHYAVVAIFFTLGAISPAVVDMLMANFEFQQMFSVQGELLDEPGVNSVTVMNSTTHHYEAGGEARSLESMDLQIYIDTERVQDRQYAQQFAEKVLALNPEYRNKNVIKVSLLYGYDIGIWSYWEQGHYEFNPSGL